MDKRDKIIGSILGMTCAEGTGHAPLSDMAVRVAESLVESGREMDGFMAAFSKRLVAWLDSQPPQGTMSVCLVACENLKKEIHWEKSGVDFSGCAPAARSFPIGLFHGENGSLEKVVDFAINSAVITHSNEIAMCGAASSAIIARLALDGDIPTGCWANEVVKVISINQKFVDLVNLATMKAGEGAAPEEVLCEKCLGSGDSGHEAIASALYCCMIHPNSYQDAVVLSSNFPTSMSTTCIVGAWMGAKLGAEAIPKDWLDKLENRDKLIDVANRLFEASRT